MKLLKKLSVVLVLSLVIVAGAEVAPAMLGYQGDAQVAEAAVILGDFTGPGDTCTRCGQAKNPNTVYWTYPGYYMVQSTSYNSDVWHFQYMLHTAFTGSIMDPGTPDGYFGPATYKALKNFQAIHHQTSDGIIGQNSWIEACLHFENSPY